MTGLKVWRYFTDRWGKRQTYAAAEIDGVRVVGIPVETDGARCVRALLPVKGRLEATVNTLLDERVQREINGSILDQLKRYLRMTEELHLEGGEYAPPSMRIWVTLREAGYSPCEGRKNQIATVALDNGLELHGYYIQWAARDTVRIQPPAAEGYRKLIALHDDQAQWQTLQEEICRLLNTPPQPRPQQGRKSARPAPVKPVQPAAPVNEDDLTDEEATAALEGDSPVAVKKKRPLNRYGRVMDSDDTGLLKYTSGNVLRPAQMIEKLRNGQTYRIPNPDERSIINALSNGYINMQDIELLSYIASFRFTISTMLLNFYGGGYITDATPLKRFSAQRLMKQLNRLEKYGLITRCQFISVGEQGDLDFDRRSIGRINVLAPYGGRVLREMGREGSAMPFDVYQDGEAVRERLCINQWVACWMFSYPEAVGMNFGFGENVYRMDLNLSGARMPAWVRAGGRLLIGQHVRRCHERARDAQVSEMTGKVRRLAALFEDLGKLHIFDGDNYQPLQLEERPIVHYICEDEAHMREVADILRPEMAAHQEFWLTYDQRVFNYEFEGRRFWRMKPGEEEGWIDGGLALGIGEERKEEKRLNALDAKA